MVTTLLFPKDMVPTIMKKKEISGQKKILLLPQNNVGSRIKTLGPRCKVLMGQLGTVFRYLPNNLFPRLSEILKKMNMGGTSYASQKFETLMFMMYVIIHLMTSKTNEAYPNC